jgi:hypothetical protein
MPDSAAKAVDLLDDARPSATGNAIGRMEDSATRSALWFTLLAAGFERAGEM